ncbi:MAG: hypothetical protein RLZZ127_3070, partial [Planctomycetota bacterium]
MRPLLLLLLAVGLAAGEARHRFATLVD